MGGRISSSYGLLGVVTGLSLFVFAPDTLAQTVDICDRTAEVEEEILEEINVSGLTCDAVTSAQLSSVSALDLSSKSITSLDEDDFDGLSGLVTLQLNNNSLSSLDEDLFEGLSKLSTLYLNNNSLSSLDEDLFEGLSSLTTLSLQWNSSLSSLDEDLFDGLSSLRTLNLNNNSFSSLDEDLFDGLSSLETLNLRSNSLSSLDEDLFEGLSSLVTLTLDGNSLTSLHVDIFDGLSSLESLDLSGNGLTSPPADLFDGLSSLTLLDLYNNSIGSPPADLFDGLSSLTTLDLRVNGLSTPDANLFEGLSSLTTLQLSVNSLSSLDKDLFDGLSSLVTLNLNNNSLSSLDEDLFDGLSSLETLNLNNNSLSSLPEDLLDGLSSLTTLNLESNSLTTLPDNIFEDVGTGLQVQLRRNTIVCLPQTIVDLESGGTITISGYTPIVTCTTPEVTLVLTPETIMEGAGSSTVTATLNAVSPVVTTIEVSVVPDSPATTSDFSLTTNKTLTIAAGETTSTGSVVIGAGSNDVDEPNKTFQVKGTATNTRGVTGPSDVTLTITDNDDTPRVRLFRRPEIISENGGSTTVTATLNWASSEETTIEVSVVPDPPATTSDYTLSSNMTLTIAAGETTSTGTVTITAVDDNVDELFKRVYVEGVATNTQGVINPLRLELYFTDDDPTPRAKLVLTNTSIGENAGSTTVTATLDGASSSEETTIEVSVVPDSPATTSDYTLSSNTTLTIAAGETTSTGTVTITAVNNEVDAPNKTVQVKGAATNARRVFGPSDVALTITDDDDTPMATLSLISNIINENAGSTAVTATLDRASSEETTIEVSVVPDSPATTGDYTLNANTTLTIAAGEITSTGTVTITAVDNNVDSPTKTVQVKGVATNTQGVTGPSDTPLTITDDDDAPTATLALTSTSINENGGSTTVTATLDRASSEETTIEVSVVPDSPATTGDYTLSANTTLRVAAGEITSTGTVTITAVDNEVDAPNKAVQVRGVATNTQGMTGPSDVTLPIIDDDGAPRATLSLTSSIISENAGSTMVTATLDRASSEETTIEVSVIPDSPATTGDYTLSSNTTLTVVAGATTSTGTVTIMAVDNKMDEPNKLFRVGGTAQNTQGITGPGGVTLMITDDDEASGITLTVVPAAVNENAGRTDVTVTATLDATRGTDTSVTVSVEDGTAVAGTDYGAVSSFGITISANQISRTGRFAFDPTSDDIDEPDETVRVTGTTPVDGLDVTGATLRITDEDPSPEVTLELTPASIREDAGSANVTATLDRASSEETTIKVSVVPDSPATTGDYTLSANTTLTIAAGELTSTGVVTIEAVDNSIDMPDKTFQVGGTAQNIQGVNGPSGVTLTITDEDSSPEVTLELAPATIAETGGHTGVTATLDRASISETTIQVFVVPDAPAISSDYTLSSNTTLTIAAGVTTSTGTVTITAVDNDVDTPDKTFQVGGTAQNIQGVTGPSDVTLTITDEDPSPEVNLELTPTTISEDAGSANVTATLDRASSAETTIEVSVVPVSPATTSDYILSSNTMLTIVAGELTSTGVVTVEAVDNSIDTPEKMFQVGGVAQNVQGVVGPSDVTLTITDDEEASEITLAVTPSVVIEDAGRMDVTVTATLDATRDTDTAVMVSVGGDAALAGADFSAVPSFGITISANQLSGTGRFTFDPTPDDIDEPDETVQVMGTTPVEGLGVIGVALTIADDDGASEITLAVAPSEVSEDAGRTDVTVMAILDVARGTDTEVTVRVGDGTAVVGTDYSTVYYFSSSFDITILANQISGTGRFAFTPIPDDIDEPNETVLVTGTASVNGLAVTGTTLTITDEDPAPVVTLTVSPASISEAGDVSTVTARLDRPSSEGTTVMITTQPQDPATTSDYTLGSNRTLTIAAGSMMSTDEVTITAVDNDVHAADKKVTVQGAATNVQGITPPAEVVLTITNEDEAEMAPIARDVTVMAVEDTPYRFRVSDFGYSDPDGDPMREVRIITYPQTGTLTMNGTEVVTNTPVTVEQLATGALVFTPVADGYGTPYTSFTFRVSDGTLESLLSATLTIDVGPVNDAATGKPEVLGSMRVGEPLRVSTQEIVDVDGNSNAEQGTPPYAYRYQWLRVQAGQSAPIPGADADFYVPVVADAGARLVVRVRFLDDAGFSEDLSSPPREVMNTGRIRQAWMARFGRAVADQVLAATTCDRQWSRSDPGGIYLAGRPLELSSLPHYVRLRREDSIYSIHGESGPVITHTLTPTNLVRGTSFRHVGNPEGDQGITFWGRGARSRFRGSENASKVDGVVTSGMVGANWRQRRISLGVLTNYVNADGDYDFGLDNGQVSGQLVGVYPNACYAFSSRVRVWAVAGYGRGNLTVNGRDARSYLSPLDLMMGGGGIYGRVRTIANRLELGLQSDALIVRTTADQTEALSRDVAQVTRLRLGLKGTVRNLQLRRDVRIEPTLEMALRHDGGDADTGFGMDMSAGLAVSMLTRGLSMEVQVRGVLTHQAQGLREQGMAAAVTWDPTPSESGIRIRLEQTMGADVFGGADRLLRAETLESHFMDASNSRRLGLGDFGLEAGYGFTVLQGRLVTQPEVGLEWWGSQRRYRMGWEFAFAHTNPTRLRLFVGATGRDPATGNVQLHRQIRLQLRREW